MRGALWLLIAALALSEVGVQAKHPFPNPLEDPAGCGREGVSSSHVCDPELLLSSEGADRVDLMARALSSGGGPVVLVAMMSKISAETDVVAHAFDKWSCRAQARKATLALGEDRAFCVEARSSKVRVSDDEQQVILVGVQDALNLGVTDMAVSFALMSMRDGAVTNGVVAMPTRAELMQVAFAGMIPFIGFGMTDNGIMILAGDAIEDFIGQKIALSTMASAAWGNLISDMAGVFLGGTVAQIAHRLGAVEPVLTHAQKNLPTYIQWKLCGEAIGVGLGCWLGMAPLMFREEGRAPLARDISATGFDA
ncbi:hypothetical protein T484DRAFT_1658375 [Baffinella frigidus]|nr:hypothetical protein T484DRAFT_1658375 [Cryptophyta sp. CCMP2293]